MEKILVVKDIVKNVRRFNLVGRTLQLKINPVPDGQEPVSWIKDAINQIITKGTETLNPEDQVSFSFCCKDFARGNGWVRFRPVKDVTYDHVWDVISSVYQSNSTGLNTETFFLGVTSVKMPVGKGRVRRYNTFEEECNMRKGIITINNKDNMCLPRALVVAIACVSKDPEQSKVRRDIEKLQTQRAFKLIEEAGVVIPEEGAGIPELQQLQQHLKEYKIVVYSYGGKGRDVIFKGVVEAPTLNLLYHEGHYNVITSLTAAFSCGYYCEECHLPYNTINKHRCGGTYPACQQSPACSENGVKVMCADCKRTFRGEKCYDNHLKLLGKSTVCEEIHRCLDCYKVVKRDRNHICGEIYCRICSAHVPADHLCYIQPDHGSPKVKDTLFVFYDLETRQESVQQDDSLLHEPNLCVMANRCDICIGEKSLYFCQKCGYRLSVYKDNVVDNFVKYILEARKKFKHVIVIVHNGQAFDHQFCLNYILTKTDLNPDLIMRGTKIISMVVGNVKFLDSLNYFPIALSKLLKAFGLGNNFKKGYFPHLFNTSANANYVGPLPVDEYYDPDNMKEDARKVFLKWYEEHKDDEFNMQRDIVEYCISDVEILTEACLKFRQQLLDTGNVCPFTEACTIASACNKVYRRNFLKPYTIGIIPKGGYRWWDNQSRIAIQWLLQEEHQRQINIKHAAKEQESRVAGVKVDGYCEETRQVFEFHGCYYHGCPTWFKCGRGDPVKDDPSQTLNTRYEATIAKIERIKDLGYKVIEMWECQFRRTLQQNEQVRTFTENHPLLINTPLNPRDAFYGGRIGNMVEYYKCGPDKKIKYVDVCSLYPWVCKYGKFPSGHPTVYVGKECPKDLSTINGVIKCKILPPEDLYHPVLPAKMNDKLMFVLCRTCGEQMNQDDCCHNNDERALTGTWIVDEVRKAVEKGYKLLDIYEVWSYQVTLFDKRTGGLFTQMMNKFIALKQQSSGWPSHCTTQEQKDKYIEEFLEREDVMLEFNEIVENPGLKSLAKLILNSFWGKLGQRENQPKTRIVRTLEEFFDMLSNSSIYVNSALSINKDTLIVNYEHREEAYDSLTTVNVVIAAYVTTQARLKLYNYLEKLRARVLYYDTDSGIYISQEDDNEYDVPIGEFLGDMTDELEGYGPGSYITEFVSGGPKNYSYKVFSTKENQERVVCKIKGIALNYAASKLINFDTIKLMVLDTSAGPLSVTSKNIQRTKDHEVITVQQSKLYKPLSTKRRFLEDHKSLPYGYKKPRR